METHISWLFLAGEYAYKDKKPVALGFLDFSTLESRRFFCEEELRINRRSAPELYLDMVAICGTSEAPHVDGAGDVIEYAWRFLSAYLEATGDYDDLAVLRCRRTFRCRGVRRL